MEKSNFRNPGETKLVYYEELSKVPIQDNDRRCTDILCIIIGLGLTIALAILAVITFDKPQYLKEVFPADTEGFTCGFEYPGFNFIYFAKPNVMQKRFCVRSCPGTDKKPLSCKQSSGKTCLFGSQIQFYETEAVKNEYGMFCLPKDEGNRKALKDQMKSYSRDLYYNSVNIIQKCLVIAAIASVIYMILVQCLPRIMNRVSVVVGVLALIALSATIILYPSNISPLLRWIVFIIAAVFLLIMVCTFARYFSYWGINGVFLEFGTKFVRERLYLLVLPIIFLALGAGFYFCEILMYRSFWSFGELQYNPSVDLYHRIKNPTLNYIISFFQIIQIIWGTMFLKEAFNYIVSAQSVQWYYKKGSNFGNATFTLVCKHLGSVIACAFMNAFFGIADFIFDALIRVPSSQNGCLYCISRFAGFFDLARSDSLTLVYLSGNSYCNSARYSEYLAARTLLYEGKIRNGLQQGSEGESQSASRIYRFATHFTLGGIITLVAFWIFSFTQKNEVAIPAMLVLLFISMGIATFFISLHADAGEAILVLFLMEEEFLHKRKSTQQIFRFTEIEQEVDKYLGKHPSNDKSKL